MYSLHTTNNLYASKCVSHVRGLIVYRTYVHVHDR